MRFIRNANTVGGGDEFRLIPRALGIGRFPRTCGKESGRGEHEAESLDGLQGCSIQAGHLLANAIASGKLEASE
jgi:hypothetical protein